MKGTKRIGFVVAGLVLTQMVGFGCSRVIVTSAQINAYFGTAHAFNSRRRQRYSPRTISFFPIRSVRTWRRGLQPTSMPTAFPIFQNNVTAAATFDSILFVQEINNGNCQPPSPVCDPTHPLPILLADANLTAALQNLPVPPGDTLHTLIDTGDVFKGNLPDYVVSGLASDGTTIIQASINISLFEHDFTAVAAPASAVPEPSTWFLMAGGLGVALFRFKFKEKL